MDVEDDYSSAIFVFFFAAALLHLILRSEKAEPSLKHIPAAGRQSYLLSYFDAFRFTSRGVFKLKKGLSKYRGGTFKLSLLEHWLVILAPKAYIEDLRKAKEEEVAFIHAANEFDPSLDPVGHYKAVTHQNLNDLTRHISQNIAFLISDVKEEIGFALENAMGPVDGFADPGWQEIDAMGLTAQLTAQVVNRLILGLPFARHEELNRVSVALTHDVYGCKSPSMERFLPRVLISFFRIFSSSRQCQRQMWSLLSSFVRGRQNVLNVTEHKEEHNEHDLLSWVLRHDSPKPLPEEIASDLVDLTVTADRMISVTFAHVLYHLAGNPKCASPMRKETESLVRQDGWSKDSIERMHKMDSFIKESMRMKSIYCITMARKFMKAVTFSDGMYIPSGTLSAVPVEPRHFDSSCYPSADAFDGFRFSRLHEQHRVDGSASSIRMNPQFQLITTTADYLAWGYGRHACLGRFLAATVLKMMLAHVLMHYDVKFANGVKPKDTFIGMNRLPDPSVKMLIRKRQLL